MSKHHIFTWIVTMHYTLGKQTSMSIAHPRTHTIKIKGTEEKLMEHIASEAQKHVAKEMTDSSFTTYTLTSIQVSVIAENNFPADVPEKERVLSELTHKLSTNQLFPH